MLFRTLADLRREALERWLAPAPAEGMSAPDAERLPQRRWFPSATGASKTDRLAVNPFDAMPKANEKADPAGNVGR